MNGGYGPKSHISFQLLFCFGKGMQTTLKYRCGKCGCWNRFLVEKRAVEAPTSEAKAKLLVQAYES